MKPETRRKRRPRKIRRRHPLTEQLIRSLSILLFFLSSHTLCMIQFEHLSLGEALWLTLTSVTTVGYGDYSAQTVMGRFSTVIFIYIGSIALLAQVAGMYFEHRQMVKRKKRTGEWRWRMKNHIVFIGAPKGLKQHQFAYNYFKRAIVALRQSALKESQLPVIIVTDFFDDLPDYLTELNVYLVNKTTVDPQVFEHACVLDAHTVVFMATNALDPMVDSVNFELIDRLRQAGFKRNIVAEAVMDESRNRLISVGANHVVRPIRTYPELIARTILAPGTEKVIEDLFDSVGEECVRYDVTVQKQWAHIVQVFMQENYGTPLAYLNQFDEVIISPAGIAQIDCKALFVVAREEQLQSEKILQDRLFRLAS